MCGFNAGYRAGLCCAGLFLSSAAGLRADSLCFEFSGYWHEFGIVDLTTGLVSTINNAAEQNEASLGVYDDSLYTASTGELYTVNTSTGSIAPVDQDFGVRIAALGSTMSGLYGVGWGATDGSSSTDLGLYSIDPSTGLATLVGLTGLAGESDLGLSTNSSTLYFGDANELYTIAATTGAVTPVGAFGAGGNLYEMGSMTLLDGILYGEDVNNGTIDRINPLTGAATPGPNSQALYGLVPDPLPSGGASAPEPGFRGFLAATVAALMAVERKINRTRRKRSEGAPTYAAPAVPRPPRWCGRAWARRGSPGSSNWSGC